MEKPTQQRTKIKQRVKIAKLKERENVEKKDINSSEVRPRKREA